MLRDDANSQHDLPALEPLEPRVLLSGGTTEIVSTVMDLGANYGAVAPSASAARA